MTRTTRAPPSEDRLLGGRVRLLQPVDGYRVAIDPVILAAAVDAGPDDEILDAGSGTGAVALCLAARLPGCRLIGLEQDARQLELAQRSAGLNMLDARVRFVLGDIATPPAEIARCCFDQVVTNPPYTAAAAYHSGAGYKAAAHGESLALGEWLAACVRRLRPGGTLTVIQKAERLPALLAGLAGRAEAMRICPLWPAEDAPAASRVIVAAAKGARGPASLLRGLVLHGPNGQFTDAAEAILRHAQPLNLGR